MEVLAVIPCRSGSKGLPDKNIKLLNGRPMMDYAIRPALEASMIDKVIVSTDTEEYARTARSLGADVPFLRPPYLAEDVPTEDVLIHAVEWMERKQNYAPSVVVCLQCTTPFLTKTDVDQLVRAVEPYGGFDSSATVCEVSEYPEWMYTVNQDGSLRNIMGLQVKGSRGVRQALPRRYRLNGAGYAVRRDTLMFEKTLVGRRCYGVMMPRERSVDIDTELDFKICEMLKKC